jgi:acetylornithine/N-succinyldiaminopimelate aminotransferase
VPAFTAGSHGSTFGGNPISASAALAVLDTIEADGLLANAAQRGEQFRVRLSPQEGVREVRGAGLLVGIVLDEPIAKDVEAAARADGVLVNAAAPDVVRLAPPLTLTAQEAAEGIEVLGAAIARVSGARPAERTDRLHG